MKLYAKKPINNDKASFSLAGRVRSKKNSKQMILRGGKPRIISSSAFQAWETQARAELFLQKRSLENAGQVFPIKGNLCLTISFGMKGRAHEPDLSNLIEGPQDLLQELGVIENDKQITQIVASKKMDDIFDHCEITISKTGV